MRDFLLALVEEIGVDFDVAEGEGRLESEKNNDKHIQNSRETFPDSKNPPTHFQVPDVNVLFHTANVSDSDAAPNVLILLFGLPHWLVPSGSEPLPKISALFFDASFARLLSSGPTKSSWELGRDVSPDEPRRGLAGEEI